MYFSFIQNYAITISMFLQISLRILKNIFFTVIQRQNRQKQKESHYRKLSKLAIERMVYIEILCIHDDYAHFGHVPCGEIKF